MLTASPVALPFVASSATTPPMLCSGDETAAPVWMLPYIVGSFTTPGMLRMRVVLLKGDQPSRAISLGGRSVLTEGTPLTGEVLGTVITPALMVQGTSVTTDPALAYYFPLHLFPSTQSPPILEGG